jgi:hypothetical protein
MTVCRSSYGPHLRAAVARCPGVVRSFRGQAEDW